MIKYRRVIYISYDGLLDPLGASQILPYLKSIAAHPRDVHVLSFEKAHRLKEKEALKRAELAGMRIRWTPLVFTSHFGSVGKVWDLLRMHVKAYQIASRDRSGLVHARGHAGAQVGLFLKRRLGLKLIFDFRGLWVDERVDKGSWFLRNPLHRAQYSYYKKIECKLLREADQIVVLTHAVVEEVLRLGARSRDSVTVIPCCADFDHFLLATEESRELARDKCGISQDSLVLGYLGSVGGMYLSDRFFCLVKLVAIKSPNMEVLALTPDLERFESEKKKYLSSEYHRLVHSKFATRDEVAATLPAMDLLVSFIRPSYARIASSPTKLAESFAAGIPAICNHGVGDVTQLVQKLDAGVVVDASSDEALALIAADLSSLRGKGGPRLRDAARKELGLEIAVKLYRGIYEALDHDCLHTDEVW